MTPPKGLSPEQRTCLEITAPNDGNLTALGLAIRAALEEIDRQTAAKLDGPQREAALLVRASAAEKERDRLATDALASLSAFTCTPEKGYVAEPHVLSADIERLGRERDALKAELELVRAGADSCDRCHSAGTDRVSWVCETCLDKLAEEKQAAESESASLREQLAEAREALSLAHDLLTRPKNPTAHRENAVAVLAAALAPKPENTPETEQAATSSDLEVIRHPADGSVWLREVHPETLAKGTSICVEQERVTWLWNALGRWAEKPELFTLEEVERLLRKATQNYGDVYDGWTTATLIDSFRAALKKARTP